MRKTALIALAAVLVLCVAIGRSQQAEIGAAMFERAVDNRVGRDAIAGLPDGLHVALCGTGSPLPNASRAGPCNVVIAGKHIFIIDIGEGGARNINLMGVPVGRVEALFLTHFHSDHIDGMGPLMMTRWTAGTNTAPLPVYGPAGVDRVVAGFNAAYAIDNSYRTVHHGVAIAPPSGAGAMARAFVLPKPGMGDIVEIYARDGLRIMAIRVDHGPVRPAVAYRFDYKGRSAVISGDTVKSASLIKAARGTDLLVHEALQPKLVTIMTSGFDRKSMANLAQITRDILDYHTTPEEAAEVAQAAGARHLVLSHIVPSIPSKFFYPAFLGDAASRYPGPVTMGEDGMMFSMPAASADIIQSKLL